MSLKDIERLDVLRKIQEKCLKQKNGAKILDISLRHIRRLLRRLNEEGPKGIISRRVGVPGNNRLPQVAKDRILEFFKIKIIATLDPHWPMNI